MSELDDYLAKLDKYMEKWSTCTVPSLTRKFEHAINHIMKRIDVLQKQHDEEIQKEINEWCFEIGRIMYYVENCSDPAKAEHWKKYIDRWTQRVEYLYNQKING